MKNKQSGGKNIDARKPQRKLPPLPKTSYPKCEEIPETCFKNEIQAKVQFAYELIEIAKAKREQLEAEAEAKREQLEAENKLKLNVKADTFTIDSMSSLISTFSRNPIRVDEKKNKRTPFGVLDESVHHEYDHIDIQKVYHSETVVNAMLAFWKSLIRTDLQPLTSEQNRIMKAFQEYPELQALLVSGA